MRTRALGWRLVCGLGLVLALPGSRLGAAELVAGDRIVVTLRGVNNEEQQKVSGEYTVGADGTVAMPFLELPVRARGLSTDRLARAVEAAYRNAGIYTTPSVEVTAAKEEPQAGALVSVGGQVGRAGRVPFQQGMTLLQAIDAAGGRNPFGGRNVMLFRSGRQYCLDFNKLTHKNVVLLAGDSLQVEQKGAVIDRWKGDEATVAGLLSKKQE